MNILQTLQAVTDRQQTTLPVLFEVGRERIAQDERWGVQNNENGTGTPVFKMMATDYRAACNEAFAEGRGTWRHILLEEVYEALAESDPAKLRAELIQAAAVATAWVEQLDREAAK